MKNYVNASTDNLDETIFRIILEAFVQANFNVGRKVAVAVAEAVTADAMVVYREKNVSFSKADARNCRKARDCMESDRLGLKG